MVSWIAYQFEVLRIPVRSLGVIAGFVYTQTNDRYWRKNRQTVSSSSCVGRDINRNWSYKWEIPGGASTSPCSETYKGQAPGDSPEARALMRHVDSLRDGKGIKFYIDFHSYGQYILWRKPSLHFCFPGLLRPSNFALPSHTHISVLFMGCMASWDQSFPILHVCYLRDPANLTSSLRI